MTAQEHYEQCLQNGCSPRLAEMFALGKSPSIRTDSTFLAGMTHQFEKTPWMGDAYRELAIESGFDPGHDKVYLSQLAEFPGDPRAWVSGRGDIQRVCEERGWGCTGAVNVKPRAPEGPPKRVALADDILEREVASELSKIDSPNDVNVQDLRESVRQRITPDWS